MTMTEPRLPLIVPHLLTAQDTELVSARDRAEQVFRPLGERLRQGVPGVDVRNIQPIKPSDASLSMLGVKKFHYESTNAILNVINHSIRNLHTDVMAGAQEPVWAEKTMQQESLLFMDTPEIEQWGVASPEVIDAIAAAAWKVVDVETTGLTLASKEVALSAKELRGGDYAQLRLRVITVLWPDASGELHLEAFDLDLVRRMHGEARVEQLSDACSNAALAGHNAGFDAGWLGYYSQQRNSLVLDTMLIARAVRPDVPLLVAQISGERDPDKRHWFYNEARNIFLNKGKGMWTLATLAAVLLDEKMEKGYQRPKHWTRQVLTEEHYAYATNDVGTTHRLLCCLLNCGPSENLLDAYEAMKTGNPQLALIEPQLQDVLAIREHGIPINRNTAETYAQKRFADAVEHAKAMAELEPTLKPWVTQLADPDKGLSGELKEVLAEAFKERGVPLNYTEKAGSPQVGEKDLRGVGAERIEAAVPLFTQWVKLSKAQKAGNMALEVKAFAERSPDQRIHPILSHGPVTGRLSCSEPNSQQFPGDPLFRAIIEALYDKKIIASDYSALDVRVGSALCIRAQREILARYRDFDLPKDVEAAVKQGLETPYDELKPRLLALEKVLADRIKAALENREWRERERLGRDLVLARLSRRLGEVMHRARLAEEPEWSALRDAFRLNLDIHTYTALKMTGKEPAEIFAGLGRAEIKAVQDELKKELGGKRKAGKVANLGLLYAMREFGFMEYANKNFNMGWDLEYATEVRAQWLDAYPEVDLWHCWTELNPGGTFRHQNDDQAFLPRLWIPEPGKAANMPREWYKVTTLGGRELCAFGTNAALAFPDQGTGADIISLSLQLLREEAPQVFATCINQVHDELVFEVPADQAEAYGEVVAEAMSRAGNHFCAPFGVPINADVLIGDVWLKD